ncbi:hypothetical protein DaDZ19_19170 [Dickeya ananatis]
MDIALKKSHTSNTIKNFFCQDVTRPPLNTTKKQTTNNTTDCFINTNQCNKNT